MKHLLTFVYSNMKNQYVKWLYLAILSLVWGSSYILIKWGLVALTPLQLGSLRLLITTIVLLMVGYRSLIGLSKYHLKWLAITGYLLVGTSYLVLGARYLLLGAWYSVLVTWYLPLGT